MATNKRKVLLPHTMGQQGIDIIRARDDIEMVIYPADVTQAGFLPLLADCAGIALSGTPYKKAEMDASPAMQVVARIGVGYDAVEVPALSARKVPLMTAGTASCCASMRRFGVCARRIACGSAPRMTCAMSVTL